MITFGIWLTLLAVPIVVVCLYSDIKSAPYLTFKNLNDAIEDLIQQKNLMDYYRFIASKKKQLKNENYQKLSDALVEIFEGGDFLSPLSFWGTSLLIITEFPEKYRGELQDALVENSPMNPLYYFCWLSEKHPKNFDNIDVPRAVRVLLSSEGEFEKMFAKEIFLKFSDRFSEAETAEYVSGVAL